MWKQMVIRSLLLVALVGVITLGPTLAARSLAEPKSKGSSAGDSSERPRKRAMADWFRALRQSAIRQTAVGVYS